MQDHDIARVPIQMVQQCAVASIQVDLNDQVLAQFRSDLLDTLQRTNALGLVLDVSGIEVMDLSEFDALRQTMQMAGLMGAHSVFSGFRPGVVSALVELDADICSVDAFASLDDALASIGAAPALQEDADEAPDAIGDEAEELPAVES